MEDCQNDEKPQEGHNIHAFAFFFKRGGVKTTVTCMNVMNLYATKTLESAATWRSIIDATVELEASNAYDEHLAHHVNKIHSYFTGKSEAESFLGKLKIVL